MKTTRQNFLKTSTVLGAAAGFPSIIPASVLGKESPSNQVNIGVLGCGTRSGAAGAYNQHDQSRIIAVCDPVLERRQQKAQIWGVNDHYNDFRDLLARSDIDAVHIATGDQWHVPMSLAAARAGKDVYCEKPLGISIEQDLAARQITEKYKRVFQYGAQQRSMQHLRMGIELVLNGHIGDVKEVNVWAPGGATGGSATPVPVPDGFDYDLWLGPAPEAPFCHDRCGTEGGKKGIWFIYDYAIGFIAGWGAHPLDQLQWWADKVGIGIPVEYKTTGVIPTEGLFNTVVGWDMEATYSNGIKMYFMDTRTARKSTRIPGAEQLAKFANCTQFIGDKGWVAVSRSGLVCSSEELRRKAKDPGPVKLPVSKQHLHDFVNSIISREQPVGTLDSAIRSDLISHMGDIGIRTGETLRWDPKKSTVVGSSDAVKMMHRPMRAPWTL